MCGEVICDVGGLHRDPQREGEIDEVAHQRLLGRRGNRARRDPCRRRRRCRTDARSEACRPRWRTSTPAPGSPRPAALSISVELVLADSSAITAARITTLSRKLITSSITRLASFCSAILRISLGVVAEQRHAATQEDQRGNVEPGQQPPSTSRAAPTSAALSPGQHREEQQEAPRRDTLADLRVSIAMAAQPPAGGVGCGGETWPGSG